ncbi:hypothetical protein GIB67_019827 [Kingdonia uniflora]|uniref:Uncharacterized protein n=1 Tax=Kingdonia uniflora TaxID=39325 RepID=A0A7J7MK96_9MAGN|nr:hypothetical protein GIB67_019827 [Kingdonia uniflora]
MTLKNGYFIHQYSGKNGTLNKNTNAIWVAKEIENLTKYASTIKPMQISDIVYKRFGVRVSYYTAYNTRNMMIEKIVESYDKGYVLCPELCVQIQKSNPGSIATCSREDGNLKFIDICISFKVALDGFTKGCRPILGLDGCFLKGKYGGQCLSIISLDASNGLFPIAVFLCRSHQQSTYHETNHRLGIYPLQNELTKQTTQFSFKLPKSRSNNFIYFERNPTNETLGYKIHDIEAKSYADGEDVYDMRMKFEVKSYYIMVVKYLVE